ncbi:MAG: hypothetical protein VKM98_09300 [Cyanobacteriota bacterium]|nr:hypothetical protein [Cyanobacteriota bacterium]
MADAPYLIAMALVQQGEQRSLPLQGKSLRAAIAPGEDPGEVGRQQVLELLLRIWQRSDAGPLQRTSQQHSLLLAEVPMEALQQQLPQIKADWLNSGDSTALLSQLRDLAGGLWMVQLEPRAALQFVRLP